MGYFEDYFGIPYSLPKMDMLAVPNFSMMAMENWGLITCDENLMLWNAENGSIASKILVTFVISHELAHQDELFILDELIRVLDRDTSMQSRPVIYSANTTTQLKSMFDIFTYSKRYLIQNQYENTDEKDLWKALSEAIPVFARAQILNDLFSLANIPPDLRFITYCTAIRHGGQEEWKFLESQLMLNDLANEEDTEDKMSALTCSRDTEIMKRYLERVRENKNLWFTLDYFSESPVGNQFLWDHLSDVNNFIKYK
ncbi:unnamed protein product [Schistosoma margrebowiei]|uniref:Peptidase M1 membrane alanine aminopeptidase domain-containing protein n=1 Tax=Schistosoma margrebowiei TaxID=48269 RepID=A0A3P7YUV0_9TREM|nr:unnamed protein product [Schistosoma margrebowiei]